MKEKQLRDYAQFTFEEQRQHRKEILTLFEAFLLSEPPAEEWRKQLSGLVLMPEMLYMLFRGKSK